MKVIILSGVPGSGKSTYAKTLGGIIVSADDFFTDGEGVYRFDPTKLSEAHDACLRRFVGAVIAGNDVIVDNTNTTTVEIAPYYALAKAYGFEVELVTFVGSPVGSYQRNTHGVTLATVLRMYDNIKLRQIPRFWDIKMTDL